MKKLIAGNWKMNGSLDFIKEFADNLKNKLNETEEFDMLICPPSIYIPELANSFKNTMVKIGAEDSHFENKGAYTGDTSISMIKDFGCEYSIIGHSERREHYTETNEIVNKKAHKAIENNIIPIICVGEKLDIRENGNAVSFVKKQVEESIPENANDGNFIIAYEPVWAIGTGKIPTPDQVDEIHKSITETVKDKIGNADNLKILYGGSVKPENAKEFLSLDSVGGVLVGGASLKPDAFYEIAKASI